MVREDRAVSWLVVHLDEVMRCRMSYERDGPLWLQLEKVLESTALLC